MTAQPQGDGVLVFLPTFDEAGNILPLARHILGLDPAIRLLVVDDNSADGTGRLVEELATNEPRVTVIHRPTKLGLSSAHKLAMLHAMRESYATLVTLDADLSHDPAAIPAILAALDDREFVTGSRYMAGGRSDLTGYRGLVSKAANWAARWLLRVPLHELTTSFCAYRVAFLGRLDLGAISWMGYAFSFEIVYRIKRLGGRCAEVPIHFRVRHAGRSKIAKSQIFLSGFTLVRLFLDSLLPARAPSHQVAASEAPCPRCGRPYLLPVGRGRPPAAESDPALVPRRARCLFCGARVKG